MADSTQSSGRSLEGAPGLRPLLSYQEHLTYGARSYYVAAPTLWNTLPLGIICGGSMVEWLGHQTWNPEFPSSSLALTTTQPRLKKPTGLPPASWDFSDVMFNLQYLFSYLSSAH